MHQDSHPYYPSNADVPGYHPPRLGPFAIGLIFLACSMAVVALAWRVSGKLRSPDIGSRAAFVWFAWTGFVHILLEGTWLWFPKLMQNKKAHMWIYELWKEYARADSRFASRDTLMLAQETITAVLEGPLCFIILWGMLNDAPWVDIVALAVSLSQMLGMLVYVGTMALSGFIFLSPNWTAQAYFVVVNGIYVLAPLLIMARSGRRLTSGMRSQQEWLQQQCRAMERDFPHRKST